MFFVTHDEFRALRPGIIVCLTIACAATFLSNNYHAPVMIYALLVGMAFNFLTESPSCNPGIEFSSKTLLRIGIALLGLRITLSDIFSIGIYPLVVVASAVFATMLFGILSARLMGLPKRMGMMAGGSVAICGASAALAISSVMPNDSDTKKITIFTVICVTSLSTIAMVLYPLITQFLGLDARQTSLFLGGTIHDVAQAVGAGYSLSDEIGELSTFIKLFRVAMLIPIVVFLATFIYRPVSHGQHSSLNIWKTFPYFLIGFLFFVLAGSLELVPYSIKEFLSKLSTWLLVIAISALGVKTSLKDVTSVGWKPLAIVLSCTVFIAVYILIACYLI